MKHLGQRGDNILSVLVPSWQPHNDSWYMDYPLVAKNVPFQAICSHREGLWAVWSKGMTTGSPIPLSFSRPPILWSCEPLTAELNHMLSCAVTQPAVFYPPKRLVPHCSFISQSASCWTEPNVSKQLNAVNHIISGLGGYWEVWYMSPLNYSWLNCLKNSTKRFPFLPHPVPLGSPLHPKPTLASFSTWNMIRHPFPVSALLL